MLIFQAAVTEHWTQNNCIYLLVMPKYWGKQISASGVSPKYFKSKRQRKRKYITMASYALQTPPRVAHAKPSGPIWSLSRSSLLPIRAYLNLIHSAPPSNVLNYTIQHITQGHLSKFRHNSQDLDIVGVRWHSWGHNGHFKMPHI